MKNCKLDIPQSEYRADPALSRSDLSKMSKTPMHFKWAVEHHDEEETAAMAFGTAFHTFVLEPERFEQDYIVHGKINKRTKEGKALLESIAKSGKLPIDEDTVKAFESMRANIMANDFARELLKGEKEQSYFWEDPETGIALKCRPDCRADFGDFGIIVDLKTTDNAGAKAFSKSCMDYGYDLQAAMYTLGVEKIEGTPHRFVFIAVEKKPPYACNVLEVDELMLLKGRDDMREYLATVSKCRMTGDWYGYNGKDGMPNIATLPAWATKKYADDNE